MAEGMNRTILIGNLGADPELRYTKNQRAVLSLRMATTESYLSRENKREQRTDWHSVVVWGKRGEALNRILGKGDRIGVEGRIRNRSWEAQDGSKRYFTEIHADNVLLLGGKGGGGGRTVDENAVPARVDDGAADDEMPF
jgi:single-strand DNA-binding protein